MEAVNSKKVETVAENSELELALNLRYFGQASTAVYSLQLD